MRRLSLLQHLRRFLLGLQQRRLLQHLLLGDLRRLPLQQRRLLQQLLLGDLRRLAQQPQPRLQVAAAGSRLQVAATKDATEAMAVRQNPPQEELLQPWPLRRRSCPRSSRSPVVTENAEPCRPSNHNPPAPGPSSGLVCHESSRRGSPSDTACSGPRPIGPPSRPLLQHRRANLCLSNLSRSAAIDTASPCGSSSGTPKIRPEDKPNPGELWYGPKGRGRALGPRPRPWAGRATPRPGPRALATFSLLRAAQASTAKSPAARLRPI